MTDRSRLRLVVLGVLVISLVMTLIGRLWYLQVLAAPQFRAAALDNQIRDIVTEAPRGDIVDDKGRPLVDNKTALVISVDHLTLEAQPHHGNPELRRLATLLHTPFPQLQSASTPCAYPKVNGVARATPKGCWAGSPYQPIPVSQLKPGVGATRRALQIDEMQEQFPGVSAQLAAVRHYPQPFGAQASTILGYTAPISATQLKALPAKKQPIYRNTKVGVTGLEAQYEKYLHGKPGIKEVTVDHVGAQTGRVKNTQPRQGDDIVTNIDAKAQATLEQQVQDAITTARNNSYTADYAAGVVLNARTGGIVAMASEPTYNPAHPPPTLTKTRYNYLEHRLSSNPFVDKAYASANPPGSTFKPISSSGLLWDGTMSRYNSYDCPTNFLGRHNYESSVGRGAISLHEALVVSCDTFFFALGNTDWYRDAALIKAHKKPREGVQHIARAYGYGENPKVDLPGATYGHIADRYNTKVQWQQTHKAACQRAAAGNETSYLIALDKEYCQSGFTFQPGDQMNEDVGQGTVLASPLQVATAYAAIANGGTVFEPRVVKAIVSPTGKLIKRIKAPVRDHLPISQSDLTYIRDALYGVTSESSGTAKVAFGGYPQGQVQIGGKTGTAELSGTSRENGSWFASFGGPTGQKPQYVTVIEVDKSYQGAISAAPFVRNMWDALYGFGGTKAIFPNGIPPTGLPKVGAARVQALAAAHRQARRQARRQANQTPPTGTSGTTPPTSPTTPSSPGTTAAGLPPALVDRRGVMVR